MELDKIFDDILEAIQESEASKKKLIHSLGELMDEIKDSEIIRLCVLQFMQKAATLKEENDYQMGYVAAAADLCEMIDIAREVKVNEGDGKESDHVPEANAE